MGDAPFYLNIVGGGAEFLNFYSTKPLLFACIKYFY